MTRATGEERRLEIRNPEYFVNNIKGQVDEVGGLTLCNFRSGIWQKLMCES